MTTVHKAGISTAKTALASKAQAAKKVAGDASEKAYKFPDGWKPPKTLALAADKLYQTQQARFAMQKEVDRMQEEETALKQHLIASLPKDDASGIAGKVARVTIKKDTVPRAESWPAVYAAIVAEYARHKKQKDGLEDGAFALLQRRLGESAVKEAWNAGLAVPGVGKFTVTSVGINKL